MTGNYTNEVHFGFNKRKLVCHQTTLQRIILQMFSSY